MWFQTSPERSMKFTKKCKTMFWYSWKSLPSSKRGLWMLSLFYFRWSEYRWEQVGFGLNRHLPDQIRLQNWWPESDRSNSKTQKEPVWQVRLRVQSGGRVKRERDEFGLKTSTRLGPLFHNQPENYTYNPYSFTPYSIQVLTFTWNK